MASQTQPSISVKDDRIIIERAEITDPEVQDYFAEFDESEYDEALDKALRIGVVTLGLAQTSEQEEYVERRFEEMRHSFESEIERIEEQVEAKFGDDGEVPQTLEDHLGQDGKLRSHIEDAFGEDGVFVERLDEELGEDGDRIQQALDPDTEGTPTYRLKSSIQDQIDRLRDKIEEQATEEETEERMKRRSTLKGDDFEETVENLLSDLVYGTSHEVEPTGDKIGELTDRKVGDFVITLADTNQRIVVEAKSDQSYTQPKIKDELEAAIENRDADYGIIVFEAESQVPDKVGYFHEFDTDRLSIALSNDEEEDPEPGYLRIAFNWARTRAIQMHVDTGTELDPEAIQNEVSEVEAEIDRFSTIRKKTTSIKNTANEIDEQLDEIEGEVKTRLTDVRTELRSSADD
ncbi:hypothetical protein [Salinibaculum rarum]|uniref:hypothetical protein n=1 Tax=Salinibaculum rarum TaxID=3058903 RepID=UPI00265E8D29|nr:hypothetical protein [Salinibaculum sp. KK48]